MKKQRSSGFTLMEIMVVLAILGILVAIAVPAYQNYMTRTRVVEALEFADLARVPVELSLAEGSAPKADLLGSGGKKVDMMTALTWNPPKAGSNLTGYILAEMDLPGFGKRAVLVMERRSNGDWHCASAIGYVGADKALPAEYLPGSCREGAALAKVGVPGAAAGAAAPLAAQTCAADQEQITTQDTTGKSHQVCAKRCATGQKRDPANLANCVADVAAAKPPTSQSDCLPNQFYTSGTCVTTCSPGWFRDGKGGCSSTPPANTPPPAAAASAAAAGPTSMAAAAGPSSPTPTASSSCPPGQESLTVGDSNICIPACPSGQVRDGTMKCCAASNLINLSGKQFCDPTATPSPSPAPAATPAPAPAATPAPRQQPGPQAQKPTMANNPCGPDGIWVPDTPEVKDKYGTTLRQADPDFSKGPVSGRCMDPGNRQGDYYADVQCRQCTGPEKICEQIHFPTTCKWPNNACGTLITNRLDGTKTVIRGCANNEFVRRDWYLGTSDEDKCDVIKNNQHVAFQCSFACTTKDCNSGLRPPESSLWKPKK